MPLLHGHRATPAAAGRLASARYAGQVADHEHFGRWPGRVKSAPPRRGPAIGLDAGAASQLLAQRRRPTPAAQTTVACRIIFDVIAGGCHPLRLHVRARRLRCAPYAELLQLRPRPLARQAGGGNAAEHAVGAFDEEDAGLARIEVAEVAAQRVAGPPRRRRRPSRRRSARRRRRRRSATRGCCAGPAPARPPRRPETRRRIVGASSIVFRPGAISHSSWPK